MIDDLFKLSKLTISAYESAERKGPAKLVVTAMYNPESLTLSYESVYSSEQAAGSAAPRGRFSRGRAQTLAVKLVFDGTAVAFHGFERALARVRTVADRVEEFLDACHRIQSDTHEPHYLRVQWGGGPLAEGFDCRLQSVDIRYTSFERNGSPLRAELDARFIESVDRRKQASAQGLNSPDLTHRRLVRAGDSLPLLCAEIYGSTEHYLALARFNDLDYPRELEPGRELAFPPLVELLS